MYLNRICEAGIAAREARRCNTLGETDDERWNDRQSELSSFPDSTPTFIWVRMTDIYRGHLTNQNKSCIECHKTRIPRVFRLVYKKWWYGGHKWGIEYRWKVQVRLLYLERPLPILNILQV